MRLRLMLSAILITAAAGAANAAPATVSTDMFGAWTIAWVIGLLSGVVLMVFTTFDWRRLPTHALIWLRQQRRNAGWAVLSVVSIAVLAFY